MTVDFTVKSNTPPEFDFPIKTSFTIDSDIVRYTFPSVHDKEGNSSWSLYVGKQENRETASKSSYADFAYIENNKSLILEPRGKETENKTFHFSVQLREDTSDDF